MKSYGMKILISKSVNSLLLLNKRICSFGLKKMVLNVSLILPFCQKNLMILISSSSVSIKMIKFWNMMSVTSMISLIMDQFNKITFKVFSRWWMMCTTLKFMLILLGLKMLKKSSLLNSISLWLPSLKLHNRMKATPNFTFLRKISQILKLLLLIRIWFRDWKLLWSTGIDKLKKSLITKILNKTMKMLVLKMKLSIGEEERITCKISKDN